MGTLSNNKNKRNPQSHSSNGSSSDHIAKKPKSSRLHSYPITRKIHAPCAIISGFNSTQKRFTRNMLKKSTPAEKTMFLEYFRAKQRAIESCKFSNLEKCDDVEVIDVDEEGSNGPGEVEEIRAKNKKLSHLSDVTVERRGPRLRKSRCKAKFENLKKCEDVEVIEVGNGNVGVSGNVVEVIDVDEERSSGSGEVEEIRAKCKKLNKLNDVSVERRGPSLKKLKRKIKFENLEQCDDDVEVIEVANGNVGVSGNVVEVIDVDEEGNSGLREVEEIRAKYKELNKLSDLMDVDVGSPLREKLDGSVERRGPILRRLRHEDVVHDPFTPLTEEEEEMVATAQSYPYREKVLVMHENSNIMITRKALQCLRPHAWLNDEVINIYLALLKDRERREPKKYFKCHFFNTFFYKKLVDGRARTGYDYESVKRWTAHKMLGYSLDECDKIFVPIHKEIHWCLAVINKKDKKFQYLDSLGGADKKVLRALAKYITDEVKDKTGKSIDVTSWEQEFVTDLNLPSQENGYDCGMFMIKYIDFYSRDIGVCFSQDDMPYFRKRTAKEILMLRAN